MDPTINHLSQKLLLERLRQGAHQRSSVEEAPPPYTTSDSDSDSDSDEENEDEDEDYNPSSPLNLTINAAHSIQGSNNLIPTSPTPLADASKFSSLLLHAVNQMNNAARTSARTKTRQRLKVNLTINCGITVIGDRNVIGNVGLKPRSPPMSIATGPQLGKSAVVLGAKRKAEVELEQTVKRVSTEEASSN